MKLWIRHCLFFTHGNSFNCLLSTVISQYRLCQNLLLFQRCLIVNSTKANLTWRASEFISKVRNGCQIVGKFCWNKCLNNLAAWALVKNVRDNFFLALQLYNMTVYTNTGTSSHFICVFMFSSYFLILKIAFSRGSLIIKWCHNTFIITNKQIHRSRSYEWVNTTSFYYTAFFFLLWVQ